MDPSGQSPKRYAVIFAGAGPGDPELITVKAQKALAKADVVIYAGSLVPEAVLQWTRSGIALINSAPLHLTEIIHEIKHAYRLGRRVVRLHTGDPSLYGAIFEQMMELNQSDIPYKVIPGVTAAFAAAAAMGIEYTLPEVSQTLILTRIAGRTPVPETESLQSLARHKTSMAIYLSIKLIDEVATVLAESYGAEATCAIAYRVSQPEEKIIFSKLKHLKETVAKEKITKQALIIVGKVLEASKPESAPKSKLYDKNFAHQYRSAS